MNICKTRAAAYALPVFEHWLLSETLLPYYAVEIQGGTNPASYTETETLSLTKKENNSKNSKHFNVPFF